VNTLLVRWSGAAFAVGLLTTLSSGCAVDGGGYGYGADVGIGADYYEPYGYDYGGWGPGYRVGPYRGDGQRREHSGGAPSPHAYRSAPASHAMPSIPSGSRSTGARAGGSHSGGSRSR